MANNKNEQPLIPPKWKKFEISKYAPDYTDGTTREVAEAEILGLRVRLNDLQNVMYADRQRSMLVVLQGIDTSGKDGTVNSVFREVGPLGCHVVNFGVPSSQEAAHDHLWRYHMEAPERGKIVVFNRSHYEGVLVERVKEFATKDAWERRFEEYNTFERFLTLEGTVVMKFFLHISKEEQRERLQERIDNPKKHWKFRAGDLDDRVLWDKYQAAFEDMVDRCNTDEAPWHVVPADRKWYRDWVVAKALVARLESMDLRYPPAAPGVVGTKVV